MKKLFSLLLVIAMIATCASVLFVGASAEETPIALTVLEAPSYLDTYNGIVNDGILGVASYDPNQWAGFYNNADNANNNFDGVEGFIVVDLGAEYNLTKLRTHVWGSGSSGISEYAAIEFFVSDDNTNWTLIKKVDDAAGLKGEPAWVELETTASARYVKYGYVKVNGVFMFVSEVEAYGTKAAGGETSEPAASGSYEYKDILNGNDWVKCDSFETDGGVLNTDNGKLVLSSAANWPNIECTFAEPITVDKDAKIKVKFSLKSGSTTIHLNADNGKSIFAHQFSGGTLDGVGDLTQAGDYVVELAVKDLAWNIYDASVSYAGKEAITDDQITLTGITIFVSASPAEVEIQEIAVEQAVEAPATSDEPASEKPTDPTSDTGIIALAVIAAIAVAGAVVVKKSR